MQQLFILILLNNLYAIMILLMDVCGLVVIICLSFTIHFEFTYKCTTCEQDVAFQGVKVKTVIYLSIQLENVEQAFE